MMGHDADSVIDLATEYVEAQGKLDKDRCRVDALKRQIEKGIAYTQLAADKLKAIRDSDGPFAIAVHQGIVVVDQYGVRLLRREW